MTRYYVKNKTKNITIIGYWIDILPYDIEMIFLDYYLETGPDDIIIVKRTDKLIRWDQKNKKWIFPKNIILQEEENIDFRDNEKIKTEDDVDRKVIEFPVDIFYEWSMINDPETYDDIKYLYS